MHHITTSIDLIEEQIQVHRQDIEHLIKEIRKFQAMCSHPHDQQKLTLSDGDPWDHYKCLVCYKLYHRPSKTSFE